MASSRGWILKVAIVLGLLVGGGYILSRVGRLEARVVKVFGGIAPNAVPGSVVVRAEYAMPLKCEYGGRVMQSDMDEGKEVKEGDFLLQLDPADLKLEIERIENDLKAAKARLEVGSLAAIDLEGARADFQNAERQFKLGSISDSDLQKQRRLVTGLEKRVQLDDAANKQTVETLENTLKTKQRQLEKTRIIALFDGKISEVFARKGDLISGSSPIATIISRSRTVEAKISEENFAGIKVGQKAYVRFLGYGNGLYDASVVKVLPTADPDTQRYIVHLDVKIESELLVPGITGEVSIVVDERESKTIVPRRALFQHYLYVVKDGVVEQRQVQLGYLNMKQVEIVKGVEQGELVISEELDRFHPGDHVRVVLAE